MSRNWSYSSMSVLLLFVCLIAINVVVYYLPMRADITAEKLYSISDGSRSILSELKDPLRIKYYFSSSSEDLPPYLKNYAERVREVLQEYENLSSGNITLEIFDPKPIPKKKNGLNDMESKRRPFPREAGFISEPWSLCWTRK